MDTTGVVVVGVDGSPSGPIALDHALRDAARRSARVRSSVLLGPVGLHCVLHAHCPVTVVRGARAEAAVAAAAATQE